MKGFILCITLLLAAAPAHPNATSSQNVNSRYIVESVEVSSKKAFKRLSDHLKKDIQKLVGRKFDQDLTGKIARRLRKELRAANVTHRILRGDQPEHVKVVFDEQGRRLEHEPDITKLAYHSKQGWTGGVEATAEVKDTAFTFGIQSDGDELLERFAGINARVSQGFGDRVRLGFDFESFHQQWNRATLEAIDRQTSVPGIYRTRNNYAPHLDILVAPGLTLSGGLSFNHVEFQFPAANTESANAVTTTLRYRNRWENGDSTRQELDAGYGLRAATRLLDSDFVYARHYADVRYSYGRGPHVVAAGFATGGLSGTAPLYERFSAGNTQTLRGWNKFDLAPLGSDRLTHGTVEYRYHTIAVFYDVGSLAIDDKDSASTKHSLGAGFHWDNFAMSLAFPIRGSRVVPMFLLSANF
jgi:hypothetical protein